MSYLLSVETAVPAHRIAQGDTKHLIAQLFPQMAEKPRMLGIFDNAAIDFRHLAQPLEWYAQPHTFEEKNELYKKLALELGLEAARKALEESGLEPSEIGAVMWVSNSGFATPSLDSHLVQQLGLSRNVQRLPLLGLGCAGGASALGKASNFARALDKPVLLVAVELNSLSFIKNDFDKANFVSSGLFADGAAAAIVSPRPVHSRLPIVRLSGAHSTLLDDSEDIMGFRLTDKGLKVWLSRDLPGLLERIMPENLTGALSSVRWSQADLKHFVMHPGGAKVLSVLERVTNQQEGALEDSRGVLRDYGNMSSPTVLFVLERFVKRQPEAGKGILSAMGPGFSIEHVFFEVMGD